MSKCLLVIDMQKVAVGREHIKFFKYDSDLIDKVNNVINSYDAEHIIYIVNLLEKNFINKFVPFKAYKGSKEAELADELVKVNNIIIEKYKGDAFIDTELNTILQQKKCTEVEIVGIDGGGCASLTAFGALDNGYKVTMNMNAIGTMFKGKAKKYKEKLLDKGVKFI